MRLSLGRTVDYSTVANAMHLNVGTVQYRVVPVLVDSEPGDSAIETAQFGQKFGFTEFA